jgi:S1-C subfamily serine protease
MTAGRFGSTASRPWPPAAADDLLPEIAMLDASESRDAAALQPAEALLELPSPDAAAGGSPTAPPAQREPRYTRWLWLPLLLGAALLAPFWLERMEGAVEKLQYANTRGRQRALSEDARVRLTALDDTSSTFRLVAQSVEPSVVHIETYRLARVARAATIAGDDAPESSDRTAPAETQDDPDPHADLGPLDLDALLSPRFERATSQGSGVIVDPAGLVLTNYHVIEDAAEIEIRLSDGRRVPHALVVGVDPLTDLAVLEIEAEGLVGAAWGASTDLEVGDWVLAVGNPFGLDRSVTAGIVSAKRRRHVVHDMAYQDFVQTDASVNPGSSGGPLVNLRGEVVGINTAIVGENYQGISFAIPSEIAREVCARLQSEGRFVRGWLGVALSDAADSFEIAEGTAAGAAGGTPPVGAAIDAGRRGARVERVLPDSPAEAVGLAVGDVIVAFGGQSIDDSTDLSLAVARTPVGSTAELTYRRGEAEQKLSVTVGERPE